MLIRYFGLLTLQQNIVVDKLSAIPSPSTFTRRGNDQMITCRCHRREGLILVAMVVVVIVIVVVVVVVVVVVATNPTKMSTTNPTQRGIEIGHSGGEVDALFRGVLSTRHGGGGHRGGE